LWLCFSFPPLWVHFSPLCRWRSENPARDLLEIFFLWRSDGWLFFQCRSSFDMSIIDPRSRVCPFSFYSVLSVSFRFFFSANPRRRGFFWGLTHFSLSFSARFSACVLLRSRFFSLSAWLVRFRRCVSCSPSSSAS